MSSESSFLLVFVTGGVTLLSLLCLRNFAFNLELFILWLFFFRSFFRCLYLLGKFLFLLFLLWSWCLFFSRNLNLLFLSLWWLIFVLSSLLLLFLACSFLNNWNWFLFFLFNDSDLGDLLVGFIFLFVIGFCVYWSLFLSLGWLWLLRSRFGFFHFWPEFWVFGCVFFQLVVHLDVFLSEFAHFFFQSGKLWFFFLFVCLNVLDFGVGFPFKFLLGGIKSFVVFNKSSILNQKFAVSVILLMNSCDSSFHVFNNWSWD